MLQSIALVLHVLTSLLIVGLVLLQRGKGADAGTGFGAGASGTVFGARGSANFLSRATAALATMFFLTSLTLAFFANQQTAPESLLEGAVPTEQTQPQATPPAEQSELPQLETETPDDSELPQIEDEAAGGAAPADGTGEQSN
jgi:preprotein translocase subunit SecG